MQAGRMDIACHSVIASLFLSHGIRPNVKFHLVLGGPPDPVKHIEIQYHPDSSISKKDIGNLIRSTLWKYKKNKKIEAFPGVFIEKKEFDDLINEFKKRNLYLLDERGVDINTVDLKDNPVFILGDDDGLPKVEKKIAKKAAKATLRVGPLPYFTSQTIIIINNYLDIKGIE